jgi:hypothetical protein
MRISEAAKLLGVSIDLLKKWERRGLVVFPRDRNGHRRLTPDDLAALRPLIYPDRTPLDHSTTNRSTSQGARPWPLAALTSGNYRMKQGPRRF